MAAFLGDIAFLFGILVIAAGLFTLHKAGTDPKPKLLNVAGGLLVIAGTLTVLCTTYFYFKYHLSGELDHPYPIHGAMMKDMKKMHEQHMRKMMKTPILNDDSSGTSVEEHDSHHPE